MAHAISDQMDNYIRDQEKIVENTEGDRAKRRAQLRLNRKKDFANTIKAIADSHDRRDDNVMEHVEKQIKAAYREARKTAEEKGRKVRTLTEFTDTWVTSMKVALSEDNPDRAAAAIMKQFSHSETKALVESYMEALNSVQFENEDDVE